MSSTGFDLKTRTVLITLAQGIAKAANLAIALVLVRILSGVEWATIALLLTIYTVAIAFGGLNLQQGIFFFYGRTPPDGRRNLAVQTSVLLALTGALTAALILAVSPWISDGPYQVAGLLGWLALVVLLEVPTLGAPQLLLAAEKPRASAAFTAGSSIAQIIAVTTPVLLHRGLHGAMIGLAVYAAVRLAVYAALVVRYTPPGPIRADWTLVKDQVIYTAPLGLSLLAGALNANIGKWFVAVFDAPNFGAYAIAANEVPFVSMVPYAVGAVLATRLVHAFNSGRPNLSYAYWMAATSRTSLLVVPATIGIILCSPQLITLLFTNQYAAAILPFQIHTLILLHRVAEYGIVLRAAGDTRSLWWASFVLLAANALASLPLTLAFGMLGTAAGMLAANMCAWLFILGRIARVMNVDLRAVFPWSIYAQLLLGAVIAAVVAAKVSLLFPQDAVTQLVVRAVVFGGLFLGGVYVGKSHIVLPTIPEDDPEFAHQTPAESDL